MGSGTKEASEEEEKVFQNWVDESYASFVDVVAEGRSMDEDRVRKVADGRIYTAKQALDLDLVDRLGYEKDALAGMKEDPQT